MSTDTALALRCLIAVDDAPTRDVVAEAARGFSGVQIDEATLESGREQLRRRRFDLAFVALKSASKDSRQLLDEIRSLAPDTLLVGLTPAGAVEGKRMERQEYNLFGLLGTPVDVVELFGTLRRAVDRITKSRSGS
jgi:DNA-binding NtrC family response regulator